MISLRTNDITYIMITGIDTGNSILIGLEEKVRLDFCLLCESSKGRVAMPNVYICMSSRKGIISTWVALASCDDICIRFPSKH